MTSATLTPEAVIAQIEEWRGKEARCKPIGGGITNLNFLVTVENDDSPWGGRYVLRIPGAGTDAFIDRERELKNMVAAGDAGVSPPLLHLVEPGHCTVVPFIDGETLHPDTIAGHPEHIEKIIGAVRTYHDRAVFENRIDVFEMIRDYLVVACEVDAPHPIELEHTFPLVAAIEAAMQRDVPAFTACHCDLLSENFMLDRDGRMWIIDWEYSGAADPYFDLGDFCVEHPLTAEEERAILTTYRGQMDEHRYARMMLYKLVADCWWSVWAMIQCRQSKIDFDFFEYGMNRLRRFWSNAAQPDLKEWFALV